jgi:hypothetical protein
MFAIFGRMLPRQFATYDPATSSWRMSGDTYLWDSGPFSGTWPDSGMTRNGVSLELAPPARLTDESACSSLLPTVTASETSGAGRGPAKTGGDNLLTVIALLPTPTARDWKDNTVRREPHRPNDTDTLARALTGVNTPELSAAGSASPGAQLPGQLNLLDELDESA